MSTWYMAYPLMAKPVVIPVEVERETPKQLLIRGLYAMIWVGSCNPNSLDRAPKRPNDPDHWHFFTTREEAAEYLHDRLRKRYKEALMSYDRATAALNYYELVESF